MGRSIIEARFYTDDKPMVFLKWIERTGKETFEKTLRAPINNITYGASQELIRLAERLIDEHEIK